MIEDNLDVKNHLLNLKRNFGGFFAPNRDILLTRAPGRMDIIGGGIDFTGASIIQLPVREAIIATIQKRLDRRVLIRSLTNLGTGFNLIAEFNLDSFYADGRLKAPEQIWHSRAAADVVWTDHVAGVFYQMINTGALTQLPFGATIGLSSDLPINYNMSTSGALHVVVLQALKVLYQLELDNMSAMRLCEKVSGEVVASPGSLGEHMTSALGAPGQFLIRSNNPEPFLFPIPAGFRFVAIGATPTPVIAAERYGESRIGMMMGKRILLEASHPPEASTPGSQALNLFFGHLNPDTLAQQIRKLLPAKMSGQDFLKQFKSHDDPFTQIEPTKEYHIRSYVVHAIQENIWATKMVKLLTDTEMDVNERMTQFGQIMYEVHTLRNRSYRLHSRYSDMIVESVKKAGPEHGFWGALAMGKGGGGTVAILTREGTDDFIHNILTQIADLTGQLPYLFSGSSSGAFGFNTITTQFR